MMILCDGDYTLTDDSTPEEYRPMLWPCRRKANVRANIIRSAVCGHPEHSLQSYKPLCAEHLTELWYAVARGECIVLTIEMVEP